MLYLKDLYKRVSWDLPDIGYSVGDHDDMIGQKGDINVDPSIFSNF